MLAILWLCLMLGCYAIIAQIHHQRISSPWENRLTLLMMVAPFLAAGALFGRTLLGLAIGIVAITIFWTVFYMT